MGEVMDSSHVPFNFPTRPYALSQEWRNLTFIHWKVDEELLRKHIPKELEIDKYNGGCYVGLVPFVMKNVRPKGLFSVPGISTFGEFNVRTYVTKDGIPGVYFLTLEANSLITCMFAPRAYGLPYRYANSKLKHDGNNITWTSKRKKNSYKVSGKTTYSENVVDFEKASLEYFLFERYSLYVMKNNSLRRAYTLHKPWQVVEAKVQISDNQLTDSFDLGINSSLNPPIIHYSDGVKVKTWSVELSETINPSEHRDYLFLDGDCGLCHRLASFIDKRLGKGKNLGYRPNLSEDAARVIASMPEKLSKADTVYLIRKGKPYIRSAAGIRCLLYMRWYYKIWFPIFWLIPLPVRDLAYKFIAKYRHKIFKKPQVCTFRID